MIELEGVAKTFDGSVLALQDISFSVATGSVCALLGPNGAGKTTIINILSTLMQPSYGKAVVAGYDVAKDPAKVRASISMTGQIAAIDWQLTGRENLVMFSRLHGMRRKEARARADELLEQFGLTAAADRNVVTYSGGMRRRVDIAAALVIPPKVLFLDEPTTGLDPRSRRSVWDLVSSLKSGGTTVLLTTQYLEEADFLSDSIVVLNQGRVVATGTAEELKDRVGFSCCTVSPADPADLPKILAAVADLQDAHADENANTVSVLAPNGVATLSEVVRRVGKLDIELADVSLRKPSLDEVFLHLTGNVIS